MIPVIPLVYLPLIMELMKGTKLLLEFLDRCDILEDCFKDILSIRVQFENFLIENLFRVQNMTERDFYKFIVNQSVDSAYGDYIKYIFLKLKLIVDSVKFYLFFQQQV